MESPRFDPHLSNGSSRYVGALSADPVREAPVYFSKPTVLFWQSIKKLQELSPSLDPKKDVINAMVITGSNSNTLCAGIESRTFKQKFVMLSAVPAREAPVYFSKPATVSFWQSIKKLQELSPSLDPKKDFINASVITGSNSNTLCAGIESRTFKQKFVMLSAVPAREAPVYFSKPATVSFWQSIKKLQELSPSLEPKKDVINTGVKTGSNQRVYLYEGKSLYLTTIKQP